MFITKRFLFDVEDEDVLKLFLEDFRNFTEYKVDMEYREIQLPKDVKRMSSRRARIPKDVQRKFLDLLVCLCSLDHWKFVSNQTLSNIYYTSRGELFVLPDAFKHTEYPKMENAVISVSALATELKNFADIYECLTIAEELKLAHITNPEPSKRFLSYRRRQQSDEDPCDLVVLIEEDPITELEDCCCSIELSATDEDDAQEPVSKKTKVIEIDEDELFQWCDYYDPCINAHEFDQLCAF